MVWANAGAAEAGPSDALVIVPTLIGEIEGNISYWPLKYKGIANHWCGSTAWGGLFRRYQALGYMAD